MEENSVLPVELNVQMHDQLGNVYTTFKATVASVRLADIHKQLKAISFMIPRKALGEGLIKNGKAEIRDENGTVRVTVEVGKISF